MATNRVVKIGSRVTWHELPLDRTHTRRIIPLRAVTSETDLKHAMPENAPLALAIMGKTVGDCVDLMTPAGLKAITIMEVR